MPIKLFIVDDHYMVIEGIRTLLQNEKDIIWVGHATNAASCMAGTTRHQLQAVIAHERWDESQSAQSFRLPPAGTET